MKISKLLVLFLCFHSFHAFSQQDSNPLQQLLDKTKILSAEQPIEKVYLHFDKPYYAVADTIWFKAYLATQHNLPSPLSKIVYVDLYSSTDSLVQSLKLPVTNSVAYGNIPLPNATFKQGNYYIRAYTLWMLNFDQSYFFTKNMLIGDALEKQLITQISYVNTAQDKGIKTTARIQFRDLNKKPLANKSVSWRVFHDYDVFSRGKGTTDAQGFLTVNVTSKAGEPISKGLIVADVNIADKELASASFNLRQSLAATDVQLFPEGGELIVGIPNQVAFKAIGSNGLSVKITATLVDDKGTTLSSFSSGHAGMGSFFLTPVMGQTYRVKYSSSNGTSGTVTLPQAKEGLSIVRSVTPINSDIQLKIMASAAFFDLNKDKTFSLVGQNSNVVCYAAQLKLASQVITAKIPKSNFPSGIAQFTLFDNQNVPQSERLVFVSHPDSLKIDIKSDLPAYKTRQKVKLSVSAKDAKAKGIVGDFSLTVTDEQKVPVDEAKETTILSSLLLTSDLQGYIEQPNYYFAKMDEKKWQELDVLLLSQGYRRFAYSDILAGKYPKVFLLPEQGITISGTLRDLTGMPIRKGIMRMMVTGKPISAQLTTSNLGVFRFENLNFPDSSQLVVSARYNPNYNKLMIMLDGTPGPSAGHNIFAADEIENIDTTMAAYLSNSQKQYRTIRTLKTVEIKASPAKRPSHADHPALTGLSQIADRFIEGSQLSGCPLLLECLRSQLPSFTYDQNEQKFYITRDYNAGSRVPAAIFIDGMNVEANMLNNTNPANIESVEVFLNDPLGLVDRAYNTRGVIVINTKVAPKGQKISKQDFLDMIPKKYEIKYYPKGYSKERQFYSPKYTPASPLNNNDLRTTIYWNPKVQTDENGMANVEFFNADGKGKYRVVVEGLDRRGNVARGVYQYQVK